MAFGQVGASEGITLMFLSGVEHPDPGAVLAAYILSGVELPDLETTPVIFSCKHLSGVFGITSRRAGEDVTLRSGVEHLAFILSIFSLTGMFALLFNILTGVEGEDLPGFASIGTCCKREVILSVSVGELFLSLSFIIFFLDSWMMA